ncbi:MAG: immunoglobulin domain-containing protein [Limisphaerales bacterium]
MDDVRIYNRALSSNEVAQIFVIEGGGAPTITVQPTNVTVSIGGTASFSVTATSTNQLSYQWFREGVSLPSATNATLIINNIQPSMIGNYSAVIASFGGSITSVVATLNITGVNPVIWRGLAAYYPFNGDASDATGYGNDGVIYGGVALAPGPFWI